MRKVLSLVLALVFALSAVPAMAQTEFETLAETFTYFHYSFMLYTGEYEFGDNTPFWLLTGHNYGSSYAAFRTKNNLFDVVFIPDATGKGVQEIQLLASRDAVANSTENQMLAFYHTNGMIFPYLLDIATNPNEALQKGIIDVCVQSVVWGYQSYTGETIVVDNVCEITPFVQDQTFGVCITFNTPVTQEFLASRAWLMANVLKE